jgi:hypothetical protein
MAVYVVTGKLGSGKTLVALSRIQFYLTSKRRVSTNLDIYLEKLVNPWAKNTHVTRLPDIPNTHDLDAMGLGYDGEFLGDEHNGIIVLDECAKWLNSRSWNDKERKGLIDWMIHARKKRWDVMLIIQDISAMDKQMRDLFAEHVVYCRRFDRMKIPFITSITSIFKDGGFRAMRAHVGIVKYGDTPDSDVVDRWWYRGTALFEAYDTEQGFSDDSCGINSVLPPNLIYGRYYTKWDKFKDDYIKLKTHTFLICGLALGLAISAFLTTNPFAINQGVFTCNDSWDKFVGCDIKPAALTKILSSHKNKSGGVNGLGDSLPDAINPASILNSLYITSSVRNKTTWEYVFYNGYGNVWYPEQSGFTVSWIDFCRAKLSSTTQQKIITCNPISGDIQYKEATKVAF